jgi:hypothetical protein
MISSSQTAVWLFGRGCSVACGLKWKVPGWYKFFPRQWQIACIKRTILRDMSIISLGTGPYKELLDLLASRTCIDWNHRFVTTNWDYLLQKEVNNLQLKIAPKWLPNTHVAHLNGSVENWGDSIQRSEILLEADVASKRRWSLEANKAYNDIIWQKMIIVVGISFSCPTDQRFLDALKNVEDDLAVGEAKWIVVNSNLNELELITSLLKSKFSRCQIIPVHHDFGSWVAQGCLHLKGQGVIQ